MSGPRDYEFTFTGAGSRTILTSGRYALVLEAPSGPVWIATDGGSESKRVAGGQLAAVNRFERLTIRSAVAQTVRISVSDETQGQQGNAVSVSVSATVAPANTVGAGGDVSVPTVTSQVVSGADATRRALIVQNLGTVQMRIGGVGVGAASGLPLDPGEKIVISTTAAVYVYNPHTGAQSVAVLPIQEV